MGPAVTAVAAAVPAASVDPWPPGDTLILRRRPVRAGTPAGRMSRFADPVWVLQPAHPDAHHTVNSLHWGKWPHELVREFKAVALAALDHPYPAAEAVASGCDQPAIDTVSLKMRDLRIFAAWMHDNGLTSLSQVTARHLDAYLASVLALTASDDRKAHLLHSVRLIWVFRRHLPEDCRMPAGEPWDGASGRSLAAAPRYSRENRTPRIAPDTMEPLLAWSLRMLEVLGPDIRDAWTEYRQILHGEHPWQEGLAELTVSQRLEAFLARARRENIAIPGRGAPAEAAQPDPGHLARILMTENLSLGQDRLRLIKGSGAAIADGAYLAAIRGRLDGRPWRDRPITVAEVYDLVRLLAAACFTVICYLSGARPGEALNLRRGCRSSDNGQLLIDGHRGKGHGRQAPAGDTPGRTWTVVEPVHAAVDMLESLSKSPLLFPASLVKTHDRRPGDDNARVSRYMTRDIGQFTAWVNRTFPGAGGSPAIPPDPAGTIHPRRFRRSLAYFIVRSPRGLVAAALQYGHFSTTVTLSYAGSADTGWTEDLAIERLELVLEQSDHDRELLDSGEHVSGPAAAQYKARVARMARFAGRTVTGVRNAERLLASTDADIHHGEAMTCVWQAETAACRNARLAEGLPAGDTPEQAECRTSCQNLAYTDRDISQLSDRLGVLDAAAADPLAPRPLRDRSAAQASRIRDIIARHDATRPRGTDDEEAA
jgi:integrase